VRETLHLSATERLALVESRVQGDEPGIPAQLTRYQLGNHLGSASLELNDTAAIVSYEEYTPFGSTSYQAVESATHTPKRYRYAGRERDHESGLYYQGARYYAPWLARWTSADPQGIEDGPNVFAYVRNNPVARVDASGMDTLTTVTTDNFRELLRASITKAGNFTPTDKRLDELAGQYMKSYEASKTAYSVSKDPILDEFKLQMDLFGRKTTKLKDFKPPGWEQAGGNEAACFQLACAGVTQTVKAGETATGGGGVILYEAVKRRIKTDKTASDLALSQIKRHIDSGRAIVGGVNEPGHGGQVDAVKQPVTDHYVAIYGYEADLQGNITALFARDNAVAGTTDVRFTVNATTGEITKPVEKRPKGEEYLNQEYQLSEVRFNTALPYTGDLKPENDAKQIMYWPVKKDDDKDTK
jgi:RHS repeat-associated protein